MGEHVRLQALPGLFVLFPAWLQHYVVAHNGSRPRVSISFNVRLTFPEEDGDTSKHPPATEGGGQRLTFTVPQHHQAAFLDHNLARDMVVS